MKRICSLFVIICISLTANCEILANILIDGLYYNLNTDSMSAEVTINTYASYNYKDLLEINIPPQVSYKGLIYNVTSIESGTFSGCGAESITIPNSVTKIGAAAFYLCTKLQSIVLPDNLDSIESGLFNSCSKLQHIDIPNSVTSIGAEAFAGCGLIDLTLPADITQIHMMAFSSCIYLESVTCFAPIPPFMEDFYGYKVFDGVFCHLIPLYVPAASVADYQVADQWKDFNVVLPIEEGIDHVNGVADKTSKILRNGQIFIVRGDRTYTLTGQEVK